MGTARKYCITKTAFSATDHSLTQSFDKRIYQNSQASALGRSYNLSFLLASLLLQVVIMPGKARIDVAGAHAAPHNLTWY